MDKRGAGLSFGNEQSPPETMQLIRAEVPRPTILSTHIETTTLPQNKVTDATECRFRSLTFFPLGISESLEA